MDVHSDTAFAPFIDAPAADSSVLLRDIAYERIKDAIRLSRLQPGQPLSETRLSRELGISPVSYTHLDVYKRQLQARAVQYPMH